MGASRCIIFFVLRVEETILNLCHSLQISLIALLLVLTPAACSQDTQPHNQSQVQSDNDLPSVRLSRAFPKMTFTRPIFITHAGDKSNRLFVVEQRGRILVFENKSDVQSSQEFLNIRSKVRMRHNEEGLLSLAFHPNYAENGEFFVYYTASSPRRSVLSRFKVSADDADKADPMSEEVILAVDQPYGNHNGSTILFGPDGYLYVSFGDGGFANDPHDNGQDLSTLLATIIRIDIDNKEGDLNYAIPKDNPFVDQPEARGEIWAYGLRNVWRMSFDKETGELWAGDIGQDAWEEIDIIIKGGNYGWNIREGKHDFKLSETESQLIDPIVEYGRNEGISVTGGYVYRGKKMPELFGAYIYADYVTSRIWALRQKDGEVIEHREIFRPPPRAYISSFGEGPDGEIYICAFDIRDRSGSTGRIYSMSVK